MRRSNKMKLTKQKLKEIIKEELKQLNEATKTYKGAFEYDPNDPYKAGKAFEDMFDGAEHGYDQKWDGHDWHDYDNLTKAIEEYHKEMFKIVDGYLAAKKKADSFWRTKDKIFTKWRKKDNKSIFGK